MVFIPQFLSRTALLLSFTVHLARAYTNDQIAAKIDKGTFQSPSALLRPRFRYWVPDSSVEETAVRHDIESAAAIGAGGVEFLPFYNSGGVLGGAPPGDDWSKNGFGTPASNRIFQAALETHRDAGLVMDFAIGPNQGQGVPANPNDEGLQWDLIPVSEAIAANDSFHGIIPGWGSGDFLALVSAEMVSSENIKNTSFSSGTRVASYSRLILKENTLADRTSEVSPGGHVSLAFPPNLHSTRYRLFAFYQRLTHAKNLELSKNQSKTVFDNGSYNVDHFSARGAETVIKFWEEHILNENMKSLLTEAGNYAWEDSVEIKSNTSWTPSLPSVFKEKYGYSLIKYLPLIIFGNNNIAIQQSEPGAIECLLDNPDQGVGFVNDYRGALVEGYGQYLKTLTAWVESSLSLQMSAQVSYNLPMDMEANIPFVNAPECESLGFVDNIDAYRQFSGPAVLAGKRVISNEMGAVSMEAFRYMISHLLWSINSAVVGGVNQFIIHGQPYSGKYWSTTWPGYTAFSYFYSEMWSDKQPAWNHGFSNALGYISRLQYSQQTGKLRTDVAVYNKQSATDFAFASSLANLTDIIHDGYSYSYISPDNFDLPHAYVRQGILAPDGPAYKSLVIPNTANVTLDSINKLRTFAESGFPVILSGGDPSYYMTGAASEKGNFARAIALLKETDNVYSAANGEIANQLSSLSLDPQIRVQSNGTWYTTWRESLNEHMDFAFIFNAGEASSGHIEVSSDKRPYVCNMWTGDITPVINYHNANGKIVIPLRLESNQTALIGFNGEIRDRSNSILQGVQVPSTVLGYKYSATSSQLVDLHVAAGGPDTLGGKNHSAFWARKAASSFPITNWSLTAEHWAAPTNISDASLVASKYNTTHQLSSLVSWTEIPGLANSSGVGYYSASFNWPPRTGSADGAYVIFPKITHALCLRINGNDLPALDYNAPSIDIGPYIKQGQNEILAIVPTTMWNYLRSIFDQIEMSGLPPLITIAYPGPLPGLVQNGLRGTVQIVPYVKTVVAA
ncbi:unnamed protein product [Penicillium egyptiacum]|uniref:Secreted protein n=1 Tax=Penicillium egyptiacum TaxID=1303716 RepID=A0A9W4KER4_9EURO|nr:unnamed protein product [Penicillium egyptiacum]